jgi:predicted RecA/RadA family phage recombinase
MVIDVGDVVLLGDALCKGVVAVADGDYGTVRKHLKGL